MQKTHTLLITGAASGIGAGIASQLAEAGRHVIVSDLNLEAAEAVAAQIRAEGGSAEAVALDVTSQDSIDAALAAISRPIDVLVNNAGLQHVSPLEEFPIEKWDFLVQVMLVGVARLTRAVLPGMRERGFGRIVNIGSIHALVASPYKSAYVAAKHGLVGFSKVLALETADTDITINTVCPSYVKTPLVDKQIADQARTRGISEAAFGQTIAVSQAAVNRYVRGERIPTPRIMARIVEATDGQVTANDFYAQPDTSEAA